MKFHHIIVRLRMRTCMGGADHQHTRPSLDQEEKKSMGFLNLHVV